MQPRRRLTLILIAGVCVLLSGCAQPRPYDDLWIEARPLRAELSATRPPMDALQHDRDRRGQEEVQNLKGTITLHDAVALALQQSPTLKANGWSVAAAEADAMQLGRPRNPVASFSVENFGGPDRLQELPRQTLRISQVIELADKRNKRRQFGQAKQRLAAWDYEQQRLEIAAVTATRYVAVRVAQEQVALAKQQLTLATSAYEIADDRVTNGISPAFERDLATARVALIQIELDRAEQDLIAARADLAASWGASVSRFENVSGELSLRGELPELDRLKGQLAQSPKIARWEDEVSMRRRSVELQRANAVTDPSVGGGIRYLSDIDEAVGLAEVSWPLPLLDTNEHGILAARLRLSQTIAQQQAAEAELNRQLARVYSRAEASQKTLNTLESKAIPAATAAYAAAKEAYEAGQTEYLTALDAERSLLDLQRLKLDAALAYHSAIIELERITASPME